MNKITTLDPPTRLITRRRFLIGTAATMAAADLVAAHGVSLHTPENDECIFCRIIAGRAPGHKLWEDKEFFAFLDNKPINPGHMLLVPKQHYDYLFDMPRSKYDRIMKRTRRLAVPLKTAMAAKRIGLIVEGFGVAHCHIHLVPINGPGELQKKGVAGVTAEEFERVADVLRPFLKSI